jgi:hypothetical protein
MVELFVTAWLDDVIIFIVLFIIVIAATVTLVSDRGEIQRRIGFIDGFNGGSGPVGMVVVDVDDSRSSRSKKFGHVVFLVENDTPHLAAKLFSSDGSMWFTEKPSSRSGKNTRESL